MRYGLIFDCDGVLADTELNGHLVAFNKMWERLGVPWRWSRQQYGEKLEISGGKERLASLFQDDEFRAAVQVPENEDEQRALILKWHKEKTAIYEEIIASKAIPTRPGIARLAREALASGWRLAVASTSSVAAVEAVLRSAVGELAQSFAVFAGDVVARKKPSPDIYNLAIAEIGVPAERCIVIEDSRNGLISAHTANLPVVITMSEYTRNEDFNEATIVLSSLGDPGVLKCTVFANRLGRSIGEFITLADLEAIIACGPMP
jgi:HAD superfamily hydrolase (TIGR01509 family)